jgi:hypothetical protein
MASFRHPLDMPSIAPDGKMKSLLQDAAAGAKTPSISFRRRMALTMPVV